jgi:hypothetical protein
VRARGVQKDLGAMPVDEFVEGLREEYETRGAVEVKERFGVGVG